MINVLAHYKERWAGKIRVFQIQKYTDGVELAVGAFFNGKEFVMPVNINFEHKRLFPSDIGPNKDEMGTLIFWTQTIKIFQLTLQKMKPQLVASDYVGYIDINCTANHSAMYPLEFTSRLAFQRFQYI